MLEVFITQQIIGHTFMNPSQTLYWLKFLHGNNKTEASLILQAQ